jgi:hypothetical protein
MPEAADAASGFFYPVAETQAFLADIVLAQPLASEIDTGETSKIRFFKRRFSSQSSSQTRFLKSFTGEQDDEG